MSDCKHCGNPIVERAFGALARHLFCGDNGTPEKLLTAAECITPQRLERLAQEWTQIAGMPVRVEMIGGFVYGLCEELGALRLAYKYNCGRDKARVVNSPTYGWCFALKVKI